MWLWRDLNIDVLSIKDEYSRVGKTAALPFRCIRILRFVRYRNDTADWDAAVVTPYGYSYVIYIDGDLIKGHLSRSPFLASRVAE